ncbi:hypothetical protein [Microbacterium aerolatum]|uniref:hypothetical protein n=1 Tax=Microbacterium aerolatum TaxID=153731 RepID=UPI0038502D8C
MSHIRSELERHEALLEQMWGFVHGRADDVSVGVGRIIHPLEVCAECGEVNDYSQLIYCRCWAPISDDDAERLGELGVEFRDPDGGEL